MHFYSSFIDNAVFRTEVSLKWGVLGPRGVLSTNGGYGDVPQIWVSKSGSLVCQWVLFMCRNWYFNGSFFRIFQNLRHMGANFCIFSNFCSKNEKFGLKYFCRKLYEFDSKFRRFGIWMGPFFLESWYLHGWCFKFPSGTSLPKPKLSNTPPPPGSWGAEVEA